ncbi:glycosyltransferase [Dyella tabacisoli]|uniref:Glycosyltransferase n=1 Tax=Dyella tabacisoli TaxID=2282381 RepID=A0A369ULL6_9GAMM|nr:glycosyltransferase [Dyella tabacisoli]RDD80975.1 glycosyltransferase [Dyella tabacisoli]
MPKITIISSAYNVEKYIKEMIDSVLNQSFSDMEFIISNDGSTDRTAEIIRAYSDPRIKFIDNADNAGQVRRLHELALLASGEYIGIVDADDMLFQHALEYTNYVLDNHPAYGLVYTDHYEMDSTSRVIAIGQRSKIPYSRDNILKDFMSFHFKLFRRELYGKIEPNMRIEVAQDYDFCLRLSEVTDFIHLPLPLYYYRRHAESISVSRYKKQAETSLEIIKDAIARRNLSSTLSVELLYDESGMAKYFYKNI